MRKLVLMLGYLLLLAVPLWAQQGSNGTFSDQINVRSTTSTSEVDTTMIDSLSFDYQGWPAETIYYKFTDTDAVSTTLYFEAKIKGALTIAEYIVIDSLVVSATTSVWDDWNITDAAVGVHDMWRLRKSATSDTLMAIFFGYLEQEQ